MAVKIDVYKKDGSIEVETGNPLNAPHAHENDSQVCISRKTLFGERITKCYSKEEIDRVVVHRCKPCEELNPTQTSDIHIPGERPSR